MLIKISSTVDRCVDMTSHLNCKRPIFKNLIVVGNTKRF